MSLELLALASTTHIACSSLHATASTRSQRERLSATRAAALIACWSAMGETLPLGGSPGGRWPHCACGAGRHGTNWNTNCGSAPKKTRGRSVWSVPGPQLGRGVVRGAVRGAMPSAEPGAPSKKQSWAARPPRSRRTHRPCKHDTRRACQQTP